MICGELTNDFLPISHPDSLVYRENTIKSIVRKKVDSLIFHKRRLKLI